MMHSFQWACRMRPSQSIYLTVRGLKYHVRKWGSSGSRKLFLLHGWMDVSASFQFVVDALHGDWEIFAPDWRGFGLSEWTRADSYWYPDYLADLEALLAALQPDEPVNLVGHSMGGNIACIYAGIRPGRVGRLVNMEGLGMRDSRAADAPSRYARWLDDLAKPQQFRSYASFEDLAARLCQSNDRLNPERARFLADHWGIQRDNGVVELRSDPVHKRVNPVLYRGEEIAACLRNIASPVLWVEGELSELFTKFKIPREEVNERRRCIANCTHRTIAGSGHMMHHDCPEMVAELFDDFFA